MATLGSTIDPRSDTFQANAAIYDGLLKTLRARQAWSLAGGGDRMVQRHRDRGKIPVRERIDLLIDPLSPFLELSPLAAWGLYDNAVPGAGLVTGIGTIRGVICMIIANDATTKGGIVGDDHADHAANGADPGDQSRAGYRIVVQSPGGKRRQLEERAQRIDQKVDPLTHRNLAAVAMTLHHAVAAAGQRPGLPRAQCFQEAVVDRGVGLESV